MQTHIALSEWHMQMSGEHWTVCARARARVRVCVCVCTILQGVWRLDNFHEDCHEYYIVPHTRIAPPPLSLMHTH